jgi:CHAT domain-containing protein/Tfp pilus assembly protein PilF
MRYGRPFLLAGTLMLAGFFPVPELHLGRVQAQVTPQSQTQPEQLLQSGRRSFETGDFQSALTQYEKVLAIWQAEGNLSGKAQALNAIAEVYNLQSRGSDSLKLLQESLTIFRQQGNLRGEGEALTLEADAYFALNNYPKALEVSQQALSIHRSTQNKRFEGKTLNLIGDLRNALNQYPAALRLFEQALAIRRSIKDERGEADSIASFGNVYDSQGQYDRALERYQQSLAIFRRVGDRWGEALVLNFIGKVHRWQGRYDEALQYHQQALAIARKLHDPWRESGTLLNIGGVYRAQSQYPKAQEFYQQSLRLGQQLNSRYREAGVLNSLGGLLQDQGRYTEALAHYERAMLIYRELNNRPDEANTLLSMGEVYRSQSNYKAALVAYRRAASIYMELGDVQNEGSAQRRIGSIYADQLGQYDKALSIYQAVLKTRQDVGDHAGEAFIYSRIGDLFSTRGHYAEARTWYEKSLELYKTLNDLPSQASLLSTLAGVDVGQGQFPKAMALYEQSISLRRKMGDRDGQAAVLRRIGEVYSNQGLDPDALHYYQRSLDLYAAIGDRSGEAIIWVNFGAIYRRQGSYDRALQAYSRAKTIYQAIEDLSGVGVTSALIGSTYLELNQPREALNAYIRAFNAYQGSEASRWTAETGLKLTVSDNNPKETAAVLALVGRLYRNYGKYDYALKAFQKAFEISRKISDTYGEAGALRWIALTYLNKQQYAKALEAYEQSLNRYKSTGDRQGQATTNFSIGNVYLQQNQYSEAMHAYEAAIATAKAIPDPGSVAFGQSQLANLYAKQVQVERAMSLYQQALAFYRTTGNREWESSLLSSIASLWEKQKQPELAIVFYKQSVNVLETIRQDLKKLSRESQEAYTQSVSDTYRNLANLLLSQGRVLEAQQVLELLKLQELRDYTRDTRAGGTTQGSPLNPLEKPIPPAYNNTIALGSQLTQCEKVKCAQRSQLIAQMAAANTKFFELADRLKKALREQEKIDPAQSKSDEFTRHAQKVILANPKVKTVLVYPLVLNDKLWLVWSSQAGRTGVIFESKEIPVSRKDLSAKVGELQELLSQRGDPQKLKQVSQQLYQWLIAPIRKQLDDNGVKQIVFSLDRATRYIPMAVLYDGQHFLIENFAVSTILTAEIDTQDKLSTNIQDNTVLGLGLTRAVREFPALPSVRAEIDGIIHTSPSSQGIYPGLELFDQDFTELALREKAGDYRILHIATHGKFDSGNPEDSFLVMGNGKELSIPTIKSMTALSNTHLVVLSACETGRGGIDKEGLEVAGIGHYFLLSGAKSVMASLWLVNDPATSLLMREFYSHLAKGNISKAEALRQVQIEFLKGNLTIQSIISRSSSARPVVPPVLST